MDSYNKELIWVEKEFAERYKKIDDDQQRMEVFNEYLSKLSDESKEDFKLNLNAIEEDAAIYTGLMLKVRQAFEKAKNESLTASYALWEDYEKELPSVNKKIDHIIDTLEPLKDKLLEVNDLLGKIRLYDMDRLIETMNHFESMTDKNKEMFKFLIDNFKVN
jgi:hypothetical protein